MKKAETKTFHSEECFTKWLNDYLIKGSYWEIISTQYGTTRTKLYGEEAYGADIEDGGVPYRVRQHITCTYIRDDSPEELKEKQELELKKKEKLGNLTIRFDAYMRKTEDVNEESTAMFKDAIFRAAVEHMLGDDIWNEWINQP